MERFYLTESVNLRPISMWFTLFSYVVRECKVLTEEEFFHRVSRGVKRGKVRSGLRRVRDYERLCCFVYSQVKE